MEGKYNIIWTKDSYIITNLSNGFDLDRFGFHNIYAKRKHFLRIDPVKREDGGRYRCHLRYNGEILLTSSIGMLTIREIPSITYPLVEIGRSTYKIGEEVTVKSVCEKTNPTAKLEWGLSEQKRFLEPTTKSGENHTHIWIEARVPATPDLDGVCFECKMKVEDEVAPRYSQSGRLSIIDGQITTNKPLQQTRTKNLTDLSSDMLGGIKAESYETTANGGTQLGIEMAVTQIVVVSLILNAMAT
ncbi:uncharacterized protein LOC117115971 [Anneissia japonica]|uniref:uncharacterized protein LOC117115971 n=1 Tax=Anneissia japonica TaxID=1529436 RepID=UPI00142589E6|nr:uncharacterized protein LOC117115971 [Anneissia japonica]